MKPEKAISTYDLKGQARRRLPRIIFDYIEGGAEDETCVVRNRAAFGDLQITPRYLRDVSKIDQSTALLGRTHPAPFGIAPMGMTAITRPGADLMLARAAHEAGLPFVLSGASNASIARVAEVAPDAWYQIYIPKDVSIRRDLISKTADAGLPTLVVTIDVPIYSKRERDIKSGWIRPYNPTLPAKVEALRHPAWLAGYLKTGIPYLENWQAYAPKGANPIEVAGTFASQSFAVQTWDTLAQIREQWKGRLVLKGVLSPEDAKLAVAAGADGIIVSNHGGRQFDRAPASIVALPAVAAAVAGRIPVMFDGGIMRGSDIVAALCLGADFAFIGRAALYAVAAFGQAGVARAIAILQQEMHLAMATMGCTTIGELDASYLGKGAA